MTLNFTQRHWGCFAAFVCFVFQLSDALASDAQTETRDRALVTVQAGELPIILSSPHGGRLKISGVDVRRGEGVKSFRIVQDTRTDEITEKLADAIESELGHRPFVVIARFHRKYLDVNRPPEDAYESERSQPIYQQYHEALQSAHRQVVERWGHGLLLDIHGQAAESEAIFRGTQNGKTTRHLVNRFGEAARVGPASLFGRIAESGIAVIPSIDASSQQETRYTGGHIVRTYGSLNGGTVDAIQLELGKNLRRPQSIDRTAKKLAQSIASFARDYLPAAKPQSQSPVDVSASPDDTIHAPH